MRNRDYLKHLALTTAAAIAAKKIPSMSNEPTIDQMNETIALFMGYTRYEADDKRGTSKLGEPYIVNQQGRFVNYISQLEYHISWDWLMPVILKIEEIESGRFGIAIDPWYVEIIDYSDPNEPSVVNIQRDRKEYPLISDLHDAVIEFITWYNQQTTTNEQG